MPEKTPVEKAVLAAFERDPAVNMHRFPILLEYDPARGVLALDGEVDSIIMKKRAFDLASRVEGVEGIMDRLRVAPSEPRGDGAIRTSLIEALLNEPVLKTCTIRVHNKGGMETVRDCGDAADGVIELSVDDGVVTCHGHVGSLTHKRLVGVLAWWAPGSRDVINELQVLPPEADNDGEIADALRLVLEKDPLVHADQIRVIVRDRVVTLTGAVVTEEETKMAELDAWYLTGVHDVINEIEVRR